MPSPATRTADGTGEVPVPAYELFSSTEILGRMAMPKMLAGISTRRYPVGLEPVGQRTERAATATSESAISRRFVAPTETALSELLAATLHELDLVALMIDGVHFGDHRCVVALGIGIDGTKHPPADGQRSREPCRAHRIGCTALPQAKREARDGQIVRYLVVSVSNCQILSTRRA